MASVLLRLGLLGLEQTRRRLSLRYLPIRSRGLEIGALHCPLPLPEGSRALYIDINMPETLKELRVDAGVVIVTPDILTDGFSLSCIAPQSQDFVIANHVLEHTADALGTLKNWLLALKPGGVIFVSVPIAERCFDRGREITPSTHFLEDYQLGLAGDVMAMRKRNRVHIEEYLNVSAPALSVMQGVPWEPPEGEEREELIERLLGSGSGHIHHHVFSRDSFSDLLGLLDDVYSGSVRIEHVARSRIETVGIIRKLS
ncbi:class I SAM-dependent methyltransferase [Solemya velesiana gill symbiont]|nr:methyltransferase domain-containing protein [Solemya velesiana gill symbiont]